MSSYGPPGSSGRVHRSTSHTTTWPLSVPAAASDPSGLNATLRIFPASQVKVFAGAQVEVSQNFTVLSLLVAARYLPDGWNAIPVNSLRLSLRSFATGRDRSSAENTTTHTVRTPAMNR